MFSQRRSYYLSHPVWPAASLHYSTTQFVVVSLCCLSLRHDDMKFIVVFFFFNGFCAKQQKKSQRKINQYSVIEHNALSDNYMENIIKRSHPKMTGKNDRQDKSLTSQVHHQAGHREKRIKRQLYGKYYKMFASKNDWSKWPARREFDPSSPRSGRTLSVDWLLFWAL